MKLTLNILPAEAAAVCIHLRAAYAAAKAAGAPDAELRALDYVASTLAHNATRADPGMISVLAPSRPDALPAHAR